MTRWTLAGIGAAVALLMALSAVAFAATFEGRGKEDPKVRVSFEKSPDEIRQFRIGRARFSCTHRKPFRETMRAGEMNLDARSRFHGRFTDSGGTLSLRVEGQLERGAAQGTFRAVVYYRLGHCRTGQVAWKARRSTR
jgi:hypothetical protein